MKIFIIGAEGAGKTVFLTMMSRFAADHSDRYVLEPVDKASSEYVADKLEILECGKWPVSNPPGSHKGLAWKFGRKGESRTHTIRLFDYAGQTMREALLKGGSQEESHLSDEHKRLLNEIKDADMLIYLLNMGDLIDMPDLKASNENAWLFSTFVNNKTLAGKRRLVVVTKADLYAGMIENANFDLRKMIADHWPKVGTTLVENRNDKIRFIEVSSVKSDTFIDKDGPERIPERPLKSEGFQKLFSHIFESIDNDGCSRLARKIHKALYSSFQKPFVAAIRLIRACIKDKRVKIFTIVSGFAILLSGAVLFRSMTTELHQFVFITGTSDGAGTDGTVTIRIHSQNGATTVVPFKGDKMIFENGNRDKFEKRISKTEEIVKIDVVLSNEGHKPAWQLGQVSIIQTHSGTRFDFPYGNWIGNDMYNEGSPFWEITLRPKLPSTS